jgi:hypothetical protein
MMKPKEAAALKAESDRRRQAKLAKYARVQEAWLEERLPTFVLAERFGLTRDQVCAALAMPRLKP